MQAGIQAGLVEHPGPLLLAAGVLAKESAELRIKTLLAEFKQLAQSKIDHCMLRLCQKDSIQQSLADAALVTAGISEMVESSQQWTVEQATGHNNDQLTACQQLIATFEATRQAKEQLQACLEQEQTLLNELQDPVNVCLQQTTQILRSTVDKMRLDDPQREQRHTEMLFRSGTRSPVPSIALTHQLRICCYMCMVRVCARVYMHCDLCVERMMMCDA